MPVALISTKTSPAFGPSRSSSTISSGFLASKATAARVFMVGSCRVRNSSSALSMLRAHAGVLGFGVSRRLVFVFRRTHAPQCVVGTSSQVNVNIVHVAAHVRIGAEGGHYVFLRRTDVLAAACNRAQKIAVTHRLERVFQCRRVARSHTIRSVADMAFRMVPA